MRQLITAAVLAPLTLAYLVVIVTTAVPLAVSLVYGSGVLLGGLWSRLE